MTKDRAISLNAVKDILKKANMEEFDIVAYRNIMQLPPVTPNEEEMTIKYIEGYNVGFWHAQAIFQKETKTGHWIENAPEYQNIDPPYICSECGNMHLRKTNYCDHCGAKMVEEQESNEISDHNLKLWEGIFETESEGK